MSRILIMAAGAAVAALLALAPVVADDAAAEQTLSADGKEASAVESTPLRATTPVPANARVARLKTVSPKAAFNCSSGVQAVSQRAGRAVAHCVYIRRGYSVRVRADCPFFPDLYSNWNAGFKRNVWMKTRACIGIRRAILEFR